MADLIDRAALLADIDELHEHCGHCDGYGYISKDKAMEKVKAAPAVDAVEVVRCKDCKDWIRHSGHASYSPTGACFIWAETTLGEDFCSYGERKET